MHILNLSRCLVLNTGSKRGHEHSYQDRVNIICSTSHGGKGICKRTDTGHIDNYISQSVANCNQLQGIASEASVLPRIEAYILVNNHSSDKAAKISCWNEVLTFTRFLTQRGSLRRLGVLLSCVPFSNLPFKRVNIFQTLKLTAPLFRFIVRQQRERRR